MTVEISVRRVLGVVRDFEASGGASIGLVAWELSVDEALVAPAWDRAVADGQLARQGVDPVNDEELWGLTAAGWALLGVSPDTDRRRREVVGRLGILDRVGDPSLTALTRIASFIAGGGFAAIHIFDDRYQLRVAAANAPLGKHPAHDALCRVVLDEDRAVISADIADDPRFAHSSFVQGPEPVHFYASLPLHPAGDEAVVGTLCLFDTVPRELGSEHVALLEDLAEQIVEQIEFARLAIDGEQVPTHDPLTGAVNRLLLWDRMEQALARQRRGGGKVFVVRVEVEDVAATGPERTAGQSDGPREAVAVEVARRLAASVRANDTVARLGDGELVVVAELPAGGSSAQILDRIRQELAGTVAVDGGSVEIRAAIGGASAQLDLDPSAALARADRALHSPSRPRA
jgi:diguanylate cyclase (GGDEF)-like protein